MLANTAESWGTPAKFFHWTVRAPILVKMALGSSAGAGRLSPMKVDLFVWHKSTGVLILVLMLPRLAWRLGNPSPALPANTPPWERTAAHASHALLYGLALALPLSGWVINSAAGVPFSVFWLVPFSSLVGPGRPPGTPAE